MAESKVKPKLKDILPHIADENKHKIINDLVSWLVENKMTPGWAGYHNAWDSKCKGKKICKIGLSMDMKNIESTWSIVLYLYSMAEYEKFIIEENIQNFIWENIKHCNSCGDCTPGEVLIILDKEIKGACTWSVIRPGYNQIQFGNPNESDIVKIKRLIELEQQARKNI